MSWTGADFQDGGLSLGLDISEAGTVSIANAEDFEESLRLTAIVTADHVSPEGNPAEGLVQAMTLRDAAAGFLMPAGPILLALFNSFTGSLPVEQPLSQRPSLLDQRMSGALLELAHAGLRPELRFPAWMIADQLVWPADSPLSETEIRGEVVAMLAELEVIQEQYRALAQRAEALSTRLPNPPDQELEFEVPTSVYGHLHDMVVTFHSDLAVDEADDMRGMLAKTPEGLRKQWLQNMLTAPPNALTESQAEQAWEMFVAEEVPACSG